MLHTAGVSRDDGQGPATGGHGLRDDYPRASGIGVAVGIGGLWGILCYSILWEGTPAEVDRRFVESALGTLVLLPARLVLWAIRWVELLLDRTFDFSSNHLWIAVATSAVGAALALIGFLTLRAAARRVRTRRRG